MVDEGLNLVLLSRDRGLIAIECECLRGFANYRTEAAHAVQGIYPVPVDWSVELHRKCYSIPIGINQFRWHFCEWLIRLSRFDDGPIDLAQFLKRDSCGLITLYESLHICD